LVSLKNTTQNKFYNSLKSELISICKTNHAKNKDLIATTPVACGRYCRGIPSKIGFNLLGYVDLQIWIYK
jgi:hypothetical protein